jgi:UDP-N-acetylmuramyl pentapeptide synthase
VQGHEMTVTSPAVHNMHNALAAISCGLLYKISYNDMSVALTRFRFREARQEIIKNGRFWFIDDTYNANPLSLQSAVNTLNNLHIKGKRVIVCADMLELGSRSKALHQSAGTMIADSAANAVFTVGRYARYISENLNRSNDITAVHCADLNEVHRRLKGFCAPGDAILVKGSRGMNMERTVTFLKAHFK